MARKRHEESAGGNAPWLNTFADLMNLLLCFFVMLFAFSDISAEKFQKVSISMSNSFGIIENEGKSISAGGVISAGISQINSLGQYISILENSSNNVGIEEEGKAETPDPINSDNTNNGIENTEVNIDKAIAEIQEQMETVTTKMYDTISDLTNQYNLGDYVELSIDPNSKFVKLTLKGSVLFTSGEADIHKDAMPIMNAIGKILKRYDDYNIEIIGYTDNIPVSNSIYKDNKWLSSARALNAAEYLIDECGVNQDTLKYSGRGEYEPVSSNATDEGRAMNRRIEINIYNEFSSK